MTAAAFLAVAFSSWTIAAGAQAPPAIVNGQIVEQAVRGDLASTMRTEAAAVTDVTWFGYSVPATESHDDWWGVDGSCGVALEADGGARRTRAAGGTISLEPAATLVVLARVDRGQVVRLRAFSADCRLDAGGRPVRWLTGVRPRDSVAWLGSLGSTTAAESRRIADGAMAALARHQEPAALDWLLSAAKDGASIHTRGQALFWLAQRAGQKAVGAIAEAVDRDPDTEVKKRAVFALSQLPHGDGVPKLIDVARTHSNKAVQKQAFFWLGQSKDPRALAFFREVLAR